MPLTPFQAPAAPAPPAPRPPGLPEALLRFRRQLDEPAWCGGPAGLVLRLQAQPDGLDLQLAAGQLVLVTGLPGSGKSRLLQQLCQRAQADGWRHDVQQLGPPGSGPDGLRPWRTLLQHARGADRQQAAQQALVTANQRYYALADQRYRAGIDTFLNSLTSQRSLYSAQQSAIATELAAVQNRILLYRVIGADQ